MRKARCLGGNPTPAEESSADAESYGASGRKLVRYNITERLWMPHESRIAAMVSFHAGSMW